MNEIQPHTVPSAAVLRVSLPYLSTGIVISAVVHTGTVVTWFEVIWERDTSIGCSTEDEGTISVSGAFPSRYQVSGLEPGNKYMVTLIFSNNAGSAQPSNHVTATTQEAGGIYLHIIHNAFLVIMLSQQLLVMVQHQSLLITLHLPVSQSSGRRYSVLIVMER